MTSDNRTANLFSRVRNVSENTKDVISMPYPKDTLLEILTLLDAMIEYSSNKDKFGDMAVRLSKIAKKSPAWGWRYVQSVASGTVEPSKKFADAVQILAVSIDGIPVSLAGASPITVYAETGTIKEGSLVMNKSVRCANPSCTVEFVPNVPWRKHCPVCNPVVRFE